jgi:hypothetical protein
MSDSESELANDEIQVIEDPADPATSSMNMDLTTSPVEDLVASPSTMNSPMKQKKSVRFDLSLRQFSSSLKFFDAATAEDGQVSYASLSLPSIRLLPR